MVTDGGSAQGADSSEPGDDTTPPDDAAPHPGSDAEVEGPDPLRFSRWMRESPTGAVLTGVTLGLHQALSRREERPAIVVEAPGEPEDEEPVVRLQFDPDDPTKTVAVVRAEPTDPAVGRRPTTPADDDPRG